MSILVEIFEIVPELSLSLLRSLGTVNSLKTKYYNRDETKCLQNVFIVFVGAFFCNKNNIDES